MHPGRAVARLAPGAIDYGSPARGGVPSLTVDDVCFAIGNIEDRTTQLLLLWKWAGHDSLKEELDRRLLLLVVSELATPEGWNNRGKPGVIRRMVQLALAESKNPRVCKKCNGTGSLFCKGEKVTCDSCCGLGIKDMSARARSREVGMDHKTWANSWADKYRSIQCLVDALESAGLHVVRRVLD